MWLTDVATICHLNLDPFGRNRTIENADNSVSGLDKMITSLFAEHFRVGQIRSVKV